MHFGIAEQLRSLHLRESVCLLSFLITYLFVYLSGTGFILHFRQILRFLLFFFFFANFANFANCHRLFIFTQYFAKFANFTKSSKTQNLQILQKIQKPKICEKCKINQSSTSCYLYLFVVIRDPLVCNLQRRRILKSLNDFYGKIQWRHLKK